MSCTMATAIRRRRLAKLDPRYCRRGKKSADAMARKRQKVIETQNEIARRKATRKVT